MNIYRCTYVGCVISFIRWKYKSNRKKTEHAQTDRQDRFEIEISRKFITRLNKWRQFKNATDFYKIPPKQKQKQENETIEKAANNNQW